MTVVYGFILKVKQLMWVLILWTLMLLSFLSIKLFWSTVVHGANGILRNVAMTGPLKYLSNFWWSLKFLLINCKVELKVTLKHCVWAAAGV